LSYERPPLTDKDFLQKRTGTYLKILSFADLLWSFPRSSPAFGGAKGDQGRESILRNMDARLRTSGMTHKAHSSVTITGCFQLHDYFSILRISLNREADKLSFSLRITRRKTGVPKNPVS
jgi:hypothetical protein